MNQLAFSGRFSTFANMIELQPTKFLFLAGGSFNPPTPMHLRMFEIARDAFHEHTDYEVVGGIISPVHDSYGKPDLVAAEHRCAMVNMSIQSSDWIRLSDWECNEQIQWTRTRILLQYHQRYIDAILNGTRTILPNWMPPNIHKYKGDRVQVKLLCGADFLESFARPGLWTYDDIEAILSEHGIVVITRSGNNPEQFVFQSDLLTKYKKNIDIVTNWVPNEVSSTSVRRHLRRGQSVKYLLDDCVIDYIRQHRLYTQDSSKYSGKATNPCNCSLGQLQSMKCRNSSDTGNTEENKYNSGMNHSKSTHKCNTSNNKMDGQSSNGNESIANTDSVNRAKLVSSSSTRESNFN